MMGDASWMAAILSRWVHLSFACLLVGGTFFMGFLVPGATAAEAGEPASGSINLPIRRGFKMVVHSSVLFLLITGTYNAIMNWPAYWKNIPLTHALFGSHLLLGLIIFVILMVMLSRKQPRPGERTWLRVTMVLLFLTVLIASSLKYAREHPKPQTAEAHR
jgi:uncharacterized membrane protein